MKNLFVSVSVVCLCALLTIVKASPYLRDDPSGSCGENLTWHYDDTSFKLTINGTGNMTDFDFYSGSENEAPWSSHRENIKTIIIHEGVTSIGDFAFISCDSLTSIDIPQSVTSIGSDAFSGCESLSKVVIPDNVSYIGYNAFQRCYSLTSIIIPESVTTIENETFMWSGLKTVIIPEGVTLIGQHAFYGCGRLEYIVIPSTVSEVQSYAFQLCNNLKSVSYLGSSDPGLNSTDVFGIDTPVSLMCVPDSYNSQQFCDKPITCKSSFCDTLNNQCYDLVNENTECLVRKKAIIEEWENQTNGCVEYKCDNATGQYLIRCEDKDSNQQCINDQCSVKEVSEDTRYVVFIELNVTEENSFDADSILELFGVDDCDMVIEYDNKGIPVVILVYVEDKSTADSITRIIRECAE